MNEKIFNRICYSLYGTALGDSMGMATEMWSQSKIDYYFPDGVQELMPSLNDLDWFGRDFKKGQYTDDTENTIFIIRSIAAANGVASAKKFIELLLYWEEHEPSTINVIGPSTRKAIDGIRKGLPIEKTGYFGTTNGAAMKISPIGMISDYRDIKTLVENVRQICMPTHNTSIAIGGASAVAACVSYAIYGGKDLEELIHIAKTAAAAGMKKGVQHPCANLLERIDMAVNAVKTLSFYDARKYIFNIIGTGMETIETVPAALALILLSKGDLNQVVKNCASIGGDTDTLGAICGGICGPLSEYKDQESYELLEQVNHISFEEICHMIFPYNPYQKN